MNLNMSEDKKIVIVLKRPPHGTLYPVEGLRMSVAVSGDFEPITLVLSDAVFAFIKDVDKTMYQPHIAFLKGIDLDIILDKQSLDERGLSTNDLIEEVSVKEHDEILKILADCSLAITF